MGTYVDPMLIRYDRIRIIVTLKYYLVLDPDKCLPPGPCFNVTPPYITLL